MRRFSKKSVAAATAALVLVGGGAAYAYWTTTGSGTGSATAASSNGTIVLHASFADGLTPGASEPVVFTADNTNSSSLQVGTITSVVTTNVAGCLAADFSVPAVLSNTTVTAGATGAAVGSGTISFQDTAVSQDACKGAVITITATSN